MDDEKWLVGWREIGNYIGKSAKTAQRYARKGLPFFRDPGKRPLAKPGQIDRWIIAGNRIRCENNTWTDIGIKMALKYLNK